MSRQAIDINTKKRLLMKLKKCYELTRFC
ncbi:unnamed protein product [Brachionus calyciflorus]|uniref:Uncharacterized protein n=1 Tax=Brachionus calyciflorus TaxID=104777 RepID=A0A814N2N3_9BILA|nr:unnamed protein product [Brachionus calyciflorus]